MSCAGACRHNSDPLLLWLWCRPSAIAPIGPLAWEPPYVLGCSPKKKKKKSELTVSSFKFLHSMYLKET